MTSISEMEARARGTACSCDDIDCVQNTQLLVVIDTLRAKTEELQDAVLCEHQAAVDMFCKYDDMKDANDILKERLAIAIEALEKITDPRKRDHKEPDLYTTMGCVMFIAAKALSDIGTL